MGNGLLYKWEDNNHGLEHKCGTCKTVLSNPRAKTTCFGKHEEVCTKYHKTLFYLGCSHKCDACRKSIELHDKRHREIAFFVQRILRLDDAIAISSPLSTKKRKTRKRESIELSCMATDCVEEEPIEGDEDWVDSSTICEEDMDIKGFRTPNAKSSKKAQKARKKIAKNQMKVQIITSEDVEQISQALHPFRTSSVGETHAGYHENGNGQGLLNNDTIDANIAFNTGTFKYTSLRQNVTVKKLAKPQGLGTPKIPDEIPSWQEDPQIMETFGRLNIDIVTSGPSSRERKTVLSKLCNAIHNDLLIVENEDRDTMMRMAGYWRYVNKRTYNAMIRNNQLWDWATGAKLEEIEEVDEDNDAEIEPEGLGTWPNTQEGDIDDRSRPVESYDADYTFAEMDSPLLCLRRSVDDEKRPLEGEFMGKADTRHLTIVHRLTSSPPEPVSPDRLYKNEIVNDASILDEREDGLFVAEEQEREYYDKHYDYDYGEDLEYCRKQSAKHQNSASKSLRPPRTPIAKAKTAALTSPRRRVPKAKTPRATAPTILMHKGTAPRPTTLTMMAPKVTTREVPATPKVTPTPKTTPTPKPTPSKAKILRITIPKGKTPNAKSPRAKAARTKTAPPGSRDGISYAAVVGEGAKKA